MPQLPYKENTNFPDNAQSGKYIRRTAFADLMNVIEGAAFMGLFTYAPGIALQEASAQTPRAKWNTQREDEDGTVLCDVEWEDPNGKMHTRTEPITGIKTTVARFGRSYFGRTKTEKVRSTAGVIAGAGAMIVPEYFLHTQLFGPVFSQEGMNAMESAVDHISNPAMWLFYGTLAAVSFGIAYGRRRAQREDMEERQAGRSKKKKDDQTGLEQLLC